MTLKLLDLSLLTKHLELFCLAGNRSGAADMGSMINPESKDRVTKLMEPVFGIEGVSQEVYASNTVLNRVDEIKSNKRELIIDCDVDDFLIEPNRELHRRLV